MSYLSDKDYEKEKQNVARYHNWIEIPLLICFFIGIITAAFNFTIAGFTPIVWFIISFWCTLVIICMEVTMIRTALTRKESDS